MKLKLIAPRMSLRPMDSEFKRAMVPSLSLLTIAALTPSEFEVIYEDENIGPINFDDNPDIVGIGVNIDASCRAYEIASLYKKRGIPVVLGGIHVSVLPEEALQYADAVCIGEAEEIWKTILTDFINGELKQKYYHDKPADLALTPVPRWDLTDRSKYLYSNITWTSRGCPYTCQFCYSCADYIHKVYRNRPVQNVLDDIKAIDSKHVMFLDDNFIGNPENTRLLLKELKPLNLRWNVACSTNIIDQLDLLDEMAEAGCGSLFIGFETINPYSLKSASKYQNKVENYERLIKEIHSRNIMVNASIVVGFDDDTPDIFQNTLDWLVTNKLETVTVHILTPYPGTALYKKLDEEGRILDRKWSNYNTSNVVFKPQNMSPEELYNGYLWLYNEFYSFKNIFKRMPETRERFLPFIMFNLIYRKFGKVCCKLTKLELIGKLGRKVAYGIK